MGAIGVAWPQAISSIGTASAAATFCRCCGLGKYRAWQIALRTLRSRLVAFSRSSTLIFFSAIHSGTDFIVSPQYDPLFVDGLRSAADRTVKGLCWRNKPKTVAVSRE